MNNLYFQKQEYTRWACKIAIQYDTKQPKDGSSPTKYFDLCMAEWDKFEAAKKAGRFKEYQQEIVAKAQSLLNINLNDVIEF